VDQRQDGDQLEGKVEPDQAGRPQVFWRISGANPTISEFTIAATALKKATAFF
jgi:hypothetical protein